MLVSHGQHAVSVIPYCDEGVKEKWRPLVVGKCALSANIKEYGWDVWLT